jgi:hypothetical protein
MDDVDRKPEPHWSTTVQIRLSVRLADRVIADHMQSAGNAGETSLNE